MPATWNTDSINVFTDSTIALTDGTLLQEPTSQQYLDLITSEHNQQPQFMALVNLIAGAIGDTTAAITSLTAAFDLDQAVGVQLDAIGLWVGQPRVITNVLLLGFFGFADNAAALTFGEISNPSIGGVFYEQDATYQQSTTLSDSDYRTILRARIVRNQSNGTLGAVEQALSFIFNVPAKVSDIGNLSLAIIISAPITQTQQALLSTLDLLPRPAGVSIGSITYSPF